MYIFCADIYFFMITINIIIVDIIIQNLDTLKKEKILKYILPIIFIKHQKNVQMMILGYQKIDPKLYESKYIHDFKIMSHIKNNLTIMEELRELYLKDKYDDDIIDYDIEPLS